MPKRYKTETGLVVCDVADTPTSAKMAINIIKMPTGVYVIRPTNETVETPQAVHAISQDMAIEEARVMALRKLGISAVSLTFTEQYNDKDGLYKSRELIPE